MIIEMYQVCDFRLMTIEKKIFQTDDYSIQDRDRKRRIQKSFDRYIICKK